MVSKNKMRCHDELPPVGDRFDFKGLGTRLVNLFTEHTT